MTSKNLPRIALWTLALALCAGTLGAAVAGSAPVGAGSPVNVEAQCPALAAVPAVAMVAPDTAVAPALGELAPDLFTPAPSLAAICPLIGCADDVYCRRDRDCTAAPGGTCRLFCPTRGCCAYP